MTHAIDLRQWLRANGRRAIAAGDSWYVGFASTLLTAVSGSSLFREQGQDAREQAAWALTLYFQDAISQNGGWADFTRRYRRLYPERTLPFFATGTDYVADEINPEDIAFVLWTLLSAPARRTPDNYALFNPEDERLAALAGVAYDLMDTSFDQAPVNDEHPSARWLRGTEALDTPAEPLPDTAISPRMDPNALRCLTHTGGYPLQYFDTYADLCRFFIGVLGWPDRPRSLLPDLAARPAQSSLRPAARRLRRPYALLPARPLSLRPAESRHGHEPAARRALPLPQRPRAAARQLGLRGAVLSGGILRGEIAEPQGAFTPLGHCIYS